MKKLFFTFALVGACVFTAYSQDYKSAIGLRLGAPSSISFKHFLNETNAIEVFVGYRRYSAYLNYLNLGVLYQIHNDIKGVEGLKWYYGAGAAAFLWNYDDVYYRNDNYNGFNLGIMGNLGLDFKFATAPINLSVDWAPTFVIGDGLYNGFRADNGAFSIRYTF